MLEETNQGTITTYFTFQKNGRHHQFLCQESNNIEAKGDNEIHKVLKEWMQSLNITAKSADQYASLLIKLANGWFSVMASDVMPFYSVSVKILKYSDAELISIPVIWLRLWVRLFAKMKMSKS